MIYCCEIRDHVYYINHIAYKLSDLRRKRADIASDVQTWGKGEQRLLEIFMEELISYKMHIFSQ